MAMSVDNPRRETPEAPQRRGAPDEPRLVAAAAPLGAPWERAEEALAHAFGEPWFRLEEAAAGERLAGWGEAARCEAASSAEVPALLRRLVQPGRLRWVATANAPLPGPWLGALAFDLSRELGRGWDGFAPARFAAPRLLAWARDDQTFVAAIEADAPGAASRLEASLSGACNLVSGAAGRAGAAPARATEPAAAHRAGTRQEPASEALAGAPAAAGLAGARFRALVAEALEAIRRGSLSKVVLARSIDLALAAPVDPRSLAQRLAARFPTCRTFLLRGEGGAAFVGATPETFLSLSPDRFTADALAGSAPPGQGARLLASDKDLREHGWVVQHLVGGLSPLAARLSKVAPPSIRALPNVEHLESRVAGQLRPEAGLAEVVAALHPTPAVGGVPSAAARQFLREREQLDRGLYAGLVGSIGEGRAELAVALRSALLRGRSARVFVGAGVVEGSTPEGEWEETQLKARALLDVLEAG